MRKIALRAACLGLIIAGTGLIGTSAKATGSQQGQNQHCGDATLQGTYLFSAEGIDPSGNKTAVAGSETYDGHGHFTGVATITTLSSSGVSQVSSKVPLVGTYDVNQHCAGTEMITNTSPNLHFDLFVDPTGDSFRWIEIDPGSILTGNEVRTGDRGCDE